MQTDFTGFFKVMPVWLANVLKSVAAAVGLAAIFAWFGVYDTGRLSLGVRMLLWSVTMLTGVASAALIMPLVFERWMKSAHWMLGVLVSAFLLSIPVTFSLMLILAIEEGFPSLAQLPGAWLEQFVYVLAVSVILTAGGYGLDRLRAKQATVDGTERTGLPAFADRLPVRLRTAEIYAVSLEDHYLRVHTSAGQELILMRLADAIRELGGVEGLQTHRSWWVAKAGLADAGRENGRLVLKLKSGVEAPVSRTYAQAVREAGWV